jgi:hypothetical protein
LLIAKKLYFRADHARMELRVIRLSFKINVFAAQAVYLPRLDQFGEAQLLHRPSGVFRASAHAFVARC